ncbi:lymphocyte antigen 6S-like [Lepisosteus oculatus]|uniref:lymphocyte antigen 6S-like n=1 Tax=Lepisosteus oculatus TaxID=7918 RepID=UPI0037210E65
MKSLLFLAAVLLLSLSCGEALRCNNCMGQRQGAVPGSCTVQTCTDDNNVCVSAIFRPPFSGAIRRCGKSSECAMLSMGGNSRVSCCKTDLCN